MNANMTPQVLREHEPEKLEVELLTERIKLELSVKSEILRRNK